MQGQKTLHELWRLIYALGSAALHWKDTVVTRPARVARSQAGIPITVGDLLASRLRVWNPRFVFNSFLTGLGYAAMPRRD